MEQIGLVLNQISTALWGLPMAILLLGAGFFLNIRTGFFPLRHLSLWLRQTFLDLFRKRGDTGVTPFKAMATALGTTAGTGNIVGVGTAIVLGGPGAVFWMWIAALFGMAIKYTEVVLAMRYRQSEKSNPYGGPMYYIEKGLNSRKLAALFALLGALAAFGIGNWVQSSAAVESMQSAFSLPPMVMGIILLILCFFATSGGISRIANVSALLVPAMTLIYMLGCVAILFIERANIISSLAAIFTQALSPDAALGGATGYSILLAMRAGLARGLFSNEAGMGTSPIAHAASNAQNPVEQGMWGIFEVFIDTLIICTMTALTILVSDANSALEAFSIGFGPIGEGFVALSVSAFALSSIIGWLFYGQRFVGYLTQEDKKSQTLYRLLFLAVIPLGALGVPTALWNLADILNAFMALPNLVALVLLCGEVTKETQRYLSKRPSMRRRA